MLNIKHESSYVLKVKRVHAFVELGPERLTLAQWKQLPAPEVQVFQKSQNWRWLYFQALLNLICSTYFGSPSRPFTPSEMG